MPEVSLLKVETPGTFWVRFRVAEDGVATVQKLSELEQRLNDLSLSVPGCLPNPTVDQHVLVKSKEDRQWYRGKVLHLLMNSEAVLARVFYLDYGEAVTVKTDCLRPAPAEFDSLDWQARRCRLHNVKPLSLQFSLDNLQQLPRCGQKWDESATNFFRRTVKDQRTSVDVMLVDGDDLFHVNLYAGQTCVNDLLVTEAYAVAEDTVEAVSPPVQPRPPVQPPVTAEDPGSSEEGYDVHHGQAGSSDGASGRGGGDRTLAGRTPSKVVSSSFGPPEKRSWTSPKNGTTPSPLKPTSSPVLTERTLRRLARCLQAVWVDVAYELNWSSRQIDQVRDKAGGNDIDGCFMMLKRWSLADMKPSGVVSLLRTAGFQEEAEKASDILGMSPAGSARSVSKPSPAAHSHSPSTRPANSSTEHLTSSPPLKKGTPSPQDNHSIHSPARPQSRDTFPTQQNPSATGPRRPHAGVGRGAALSSAITGISAPPVGKLRSLEKPSSSGSGGDNGDAQMKRYRAVTAPKTTAAVATRGQSSDESAVSSDAVDRSAGSDHFAGCHGSDPSDSESGKRRQRRRFDLHCIRQDNRFTSARDDIAMQCRGERQPGSQSRRTGGGSGFVLVRGRAAPEPVASVAAMRSSFPERLVRQCERCDLTATRTVQAHCWPAVMRGHDLACVSPRASGKTLAHCVPLLAKLLQPSFVRSMPRGIGPFVVVLLPTWRCVVDTDEMYRELGEHRRAQQQQQRGSAAVQCRTVALHGGGGEEERVTRIMNGCEVIVATPPSLLRLLRKRQTSLARLCHLVFDDADRLTELFEDELSEIASLLDDSLAASPSRAPPQTLLFTSTWTPLVEALSASRLQDQLMVVCSKLEMAVSTGCALQAHACTAEQRFTELRLLVDTVLDTGGGKTRLVVCTSSAAHAERIGEMFRRYSRPVLCAHENQMQERLADAYAQWRAPRSAASRPLLVLTDAVLLRMCVDDAQCVVHFDFPASKTAFGNRLDCLRGSFLAGESSSCSSHLFVTEESVESAHTILHLLKRFGSPVPDELAAQSVRAVQLREEKRRGQPLCSNLRQWGSCSQFNEGVSSCAMRHVVVDDVDQPCGDGVCLPGEGYVKVIVMSVVSASHYWARVVSHRPLDSDVDTKVQNRYYMQLTMDLAMYFGDPDNLVRKEQVEVGDICACVNAHQAYTRARVLDKFLHGGRPVTRVHLIDEGREVKVKLERLFELPERLANIPPQAIEIFACRLRPCDKEDEWTEQATDLAKTLLNRTLNGRIALSMKGCLWLDPLIEQQMLTNLHVLETTVNIRYELLEKKLACNNPQHLESLTKMMAAWAPAVRTPQVNGGVDVIKRLDGMGLSSEGFTEVLVSHVNSPSSFYVQLNRTIGQLEDMQENIHEHVEEWPETPDKLHVGGFVLALASADDCWYRAQVVRRLNDEFCVQYVDFGNREWRRSGHLRQLLREPHSELPAQAIACSLADIVPAGEEWTPEDTAELDNLFLDTPMLAKVKEVRDPESEATTYVVEMYDPSSGQDVLVAAQLAASGHGKLLPSALSFMLPENTSVPEYVKQLGDAAVDKLPDLCRCLLHYKEQDAVLELSAAIRTLLDENKACHAEFLRSAAISLLCRALEIVEGDETRGNIVASFSLLIASVPGVCEAIASHGGIKFICQFLSLLSSTSLVQTCCLVLRQLSEISQAMRDVIRDGGGVRLLCQLLSLACQDPQIVEAVVSAMVAFAGDSERNCEALRNEGVVQAACSILGHETSVRSHEQAAQCLEVFAAHCPRAASSFRRTGAIVQLSSVMLQCQNDKAMVQFVRALKAMIGDDEQNVEYASSVGIHEHLRTILSRRCGMVTRGLAMDLQRRIPPFNIASRASTTRQSLVSSDALHNSVNDGDVDIHELTDLQSDDVASSLRPKIVWAQRRAYLKLSFCVPDVEKRHLKVHNNQVTFMTVVNRQTYHVELVLFGDVLTSALQEKFTGVSYNLILTKKEQCFWPRLLQTKVKAPFISLDFDNYDDSDEEEERLQATELRRKRKQRQRELRAAKAGPDMEDDGGEYNSDFDDGSDVDVFFEGYAPF